jgi:hypothetical protein
MREHEYPPLAPTRCIHCGARNPTSETCVHRPDPVYPRAIPVSIFAGDCTSIGDEGRAIAAREWQPEAKSE